MTLLPVQAPYVVLTLPATASYLIFANVTISNPATLPGVTCQLLDEAGGGILASQSLSTASATGQVALSTTAAIPAGTVMAVTCGSAFGQTITAASIGAIEF